MYALYYLYDPAESFFHSYKILCVGFGLDVDSLMHSSQAEVTTLKEECAEAKKRVQELLHFKEELLFTRKVYPCLV